MLRSALLFLSFLFWTSTAFGQAATGQAPTTESQAIQALLAEVHQLRQDLQAAANGARRTQILIHRLYVQEAAVERASQRLDEAKAALDQLQARKKNQAAQIKMCEDLRDRAEDAARRKQLDDSISYLKAQMEEWPPEEQDAQAKEADLEQLWRIEQAKLDQLQAELDQLDRTVMSAASLQESAHHSDTTLH
jgi:chromosome segregation ATPase